MDSEGTPRCAGPVQIPSTAIRLGNKDGVPPPCPHLLGVLSNSIKHQKKQKQQFNSQVKDLSKTLTFTEDVFSTSSPSCVTRYSSAKHSARELFQPGNLMQPKSLPSGGGRYNIRGSGVKHLPCHLEDTSMTRDSLALPSSQQLVCSPAELPVSRGDVLAYPFESFDKLYPPRIRNYAHDLETGARPINPSGSGSTILLDNNTKYKKVVQKSYPQPPDNYFMEEERREREIGERKIGEKKRGTHFRRWLDLPQPVKVRLVFKFL